MSLYLYIWLIAFVYPDYFCFRLSGRKHGVCTGVVLMTLKSKGIRIILIFTYIYHYLHHHVNGYAESCSNYQEPINQMYDISTFDETSWVEFDLLSKDVIQRYVETGEPMYVESKMFWQFNITWYFSQFIFKEHCVWQSLFQGQSWWIWNSKFGWHTNQEHQRRLLQRHGISGQPLCSRTSNSPYTAHVQTLDLLGLFMWQLQLIAARNQGHYQTYFLLDGKEFITKIIFPQT